MAGGRGDGGGGGAGKGGGGKGGGKGAGRGGPPLWRHPQLIKIVRCAQYADGASKCCNAVYPNAVRVPQICRCAHFACCWRARGGGRAGLFGRHPQAREVAPHVGAAAMERETRGGGEREKEREKARERERESEGESEREREREREKDRERERERERSIFPQANYCSPFGSTRKHTLYALRVKVPSPPSLPPAHRAASVSCERGVPSRITSIAACAHRIRYFLALSSTPAAAGSPSPVRPAAGPARPAAGGGGGTASGGGAGRGADCASHRSLQIMER